MATYFQKPENALKRSEELLSVGQKNNALDVLEIVIKSKRHRQWAPILEEILKKFLFLCTESRNARKAKDGLIGYRSIASNHVQGPESLLKVVTSFIEDGEKAVREAEAKAGLGAKDTLANLSDLEEAETPEAMVYSVLSNDISDTGRQDRDNYVKWLRFLWESYRSCLEVLKNNPKLEELYADTAKKTFAFCVRYGRKIEFKRLRDLLKSHINQAVTHPHAGSGSDSSLRLRVDIRAAQLNAACDLELWQLAFESAEDLHQIVSVPANRRVVKSPAMMNYYDKISKIFWVSENYLFHACAMQKIFNLTEKQMSRAVTKGEMTRDQANSNLRTLASKLLLGALATPHTHHHTLDMDFDPQEKQMRMAALVGHNHHVPHRRTVIHDLVARSVLPLVAPELSSLYTLIEQDFDPLELGAKAKPILAFIESQPDLKQYILPIKKMVLLKLLKQLGDVYQVLKISEFAKLANFMSLHDCEKLIVEVVAKGQVHVRLDHKNGTLNYGDQSFEGDRMRSQLTNFGKGLQGVLNIIQKDQLMAARQQKIEAFKQLAESLDDERKMMIMRRQQIEERKEIEERNLAIKSLEDDKRKKEEEEVRRLVEEQRKEEDKKKREEARIRQEKEEKELAEKKRIKEQVDALKAMDKKNKGAALPAELKVGEEDDEEQLKNVDKAALLAAKKEQEEKLKREAEERVAQSVQKLDHLERARRENERDLLAALFVKQQQEDKVRFEIESKQYMENHKKSFENDQKRKGAMMRMAADRASFEVLIKKRREELYEREKIAYKESVRRERARAKKEKEERERRQREEEERQRAMDEEKRKIFEEERKKRDAQRAEQDAMLQKQRDREAEIEAKQREREGGGGGRDGPSRDGPPRRDDGPRGGDRWGGGGDRDGPRRDGGGFGDRGGDRDGGPRRYEPPGSRGGGDRWGGRDDGPPRRDGGGFGDRGDRGGFDRDGPRRDDGPRGGDRWGGGDRDGPRRDDRGDRGGFGDRGDRGDRGGFGDRGGDRGDRGGFNRYEPRRDDGGDRGGGGGWRRSDADGPRGGGGRDEPPRERPRLQLAPRSIPKPDADGPPPSSGGAADDGFTTVSKKR